MVGDLTEKVQASQNAFERLVAKIPGYAGYKQKEQRRQADKLLRMHVARQFEVQLDRVNEVQLELTMMGQLRTMMVLERAVTKLQLLIDRIKTASYGYSGLFDAVKVDDAALDRLYTFDASLLDAVDVLANLIDQVATAVEESEDPSSASEALVSEITRMNATFTQRQDIVLD